MTILQENKRFIYYSPALIFALLMLFSFEYQPLGFYLVPITAFGIIPILELFLKPKTNQISEKGNKLYDLLLMIIVLVQWIICIYYVQYIKNHPLSVSQSTGLIISMGILCGVYGINVAHELGHRSDPWAKYLAKSLLLTSLYMHFYIEHNRGHHKKVGTPEDPATAKKGESVYAFWLRSIPASYVSAFKLEKNRLERNKLPVWSLYNEFLRFQLIQLLLLTAIYLFFGLRPLLFFSASAFIGILLLETINYVEHYGLFRKKNALGVYERVQTVHSWNSDHPLGRFILFELSRHSDHHDNTSKTYQSLESREEAPQLPTGYPGMMIISLIPPLWKLLMDKRLISINAPSDSS